MRGSVTRSVGGCIPTRSVGTREPAILRNLRRRCYSDGTIVEEAPSGWSLVMPKSLIAEDILPIVACLTQQERGRLMRLIAAPFGGDAAVYAAVPVGEDEFGSDVDPLAWESEGWEEFG